MSRRDLLVPARPAARSWTPGESHEADARAQASAAPARPATANAALRATAAADFSGVRVHTDGEAQGLAEDLGAKAFTYGQDVFFGAGQFAPNTGAGSELIAHELAHVGQQATEGSPALQFEPKGEKAGIGATPPDEDFIKDPENWGSEDGHVLFDQNDAVLEGDDEAAIKKAVADVKEPSYVHVHGYASGEGPSQYNLNLSAHRGAQVKHLLETLLPAGSKVFIFAHGESRHFGAAEANRRVGVSLMGTVAGGGFHATLDLDKRLDLGNGPLVGAAPGVGGGTATGATTGPATGGIPGIGSASRFAGGGAATSPYLTPVTPLSTPRRLMDNAGLLAPSAFHGVSPGTTGSIVDQWDAAYWKYHNLGIPDELKVGPIDLGAGALANKEVTNSIQAYHERNNPTVIEKSNQDVGAHIITSPNLLDLIPSKKKNGGK